MFNPLDAPELRIRALEAKVDQLVAMLAAQPARHHLGRRDGFGFGLVRLTSPLLDGDGEQATAVLLDRVNKEDSLSSYGSYDLEIIVEDPAHIIPLADEEEGVVAEDGSVFYAIEHPTFGVWILLYRCPADEE